jgi:hypothetical protein
LSLNPKKEIGIRILIPKARVLDYYEWKDFYGYPSYQFSNAYHLLLSYSHGARAVAIENVVGDLAQAARNRSFADVSTWISEK